MDELDAEESDSFGDYDPFRSERRQINRALSKLATGSYEESLDEIDDPRSIIATNREPPIGRAASQHRTGRLNFVQSQCEFRAAPPGYRSRSSPGLR